MGKQAVLATCVTKSLVHMTGRLGCCGKWCCLLLTVQKITKYKITITNYKPVTRDHDLLDWNCFHHLKRIN